MTFGGIVRTQWTVAEAELDLFIELAWWSPVCNDLCFPDRSTSENVSWYSSWSLLLTQAKAEAWLSLLGGVTAADSRLLS